MKCVGIQFIEAVRRLKNEGVTLKRTIHISFVPGIIKKKKMKSANSNLNIYFFSKDEEIGGHEGMGLFVKTREFQNLNVGVSLDEGMASANEIYPLYYGERSLWRKNYLLMYIFEMQNLLNCK